MANEILNEFSIAILKLTLTTIISVSLMFLVIFLGKYYIKRKFIIGLFLNRYTYLEIDEDKKVYLTTETKTTKIHDGMALNMQKLTIKGMAFLINKK